MHCRDPLNLIRILNIQLFYAYFYARLSLFWLFLYGRTYRRTTQPHSANQMKLLEMNFSLVRQDTLTYTLCLWQAIYFMAEKENVEKNRATSLSCLVVGFDICVCICRSRAQLQLHTFAPMSYNLDGANKSCPSNGFFPCVSSLPSFSTPFPTWNSNNFHDIITRMAQSSTMKCMCRTENGSLTRMCL